MTSFNWTGRTNERCRNGHTFIEGSYYVYKTTDYTYKRCKQCYLATKAKQRLKDRDRRIEYDRQYKFKNREVVRAKAREYAKKRREMLKLREHET